MNQAVHIIQLPGGISDLLLSILVAASAASLAVLIIMVILFFIYEKVNNMAQDLAEIKKALVEKSEENDEPQRS